jgi:hypothetical protein
MLPIMTFFPCILGGNHADDNDYDYDNNSDVKDAYWNPHAA